MENPHSESAINGIDINLVISLTCNGNDRYILCEI